MSCWRKSESACPTDPTNNPEREGDRLLSTAIYVSCRLITNLPYLPSLMSCKRTNSRLFSSRPIHLFFSKYWRGYAQQPHSALEVLLSAHRILRRSYPVSVHPPTSRHPSLYCGLWADSNFLNHKSGPPILGRPLQKKIYKDGEFAKRGPYNYN